MVVVVVVMRAIWRASNGPLGTEQAAVRALRAEVASARAAAGTPRGALTRDQVRAAFLALLDELADVLPERGNAILRRAIGDGGS